MKVFFMFTVNKSFLSDYFVSLAEHLAHEGCDVNIFSLKQYPAQYKKNKVAYTAKIKRGKLRDFKDIYQQLKSKRPDVVISNFSYVNPALLAGKMLKIEKNIAWQHTLKEQTYATKKEIFVKSFFLRFAQKIIVNSNHLKDELEQHFKVPNQKISVLPFWSSIENYTAKPLSLPKDCFLIGCPGRLEKDKNQRTLIQALAIFKKKHPTFQVQLLLAGQGKDRPYLEKLIASLGIAANTKFLGLLSASEMVSFYEQCDLIVLPSQFEAFGLTFIEALSLGRPVLVSETFGALNFIDTETLMQERFIFAPDNVMQLASLIEEYMHGNIDGNKNFKDIYTNFFEKETIQSKFLRLIKI